MAAAPGKSVVWIIGAGFSRSLGAPLLNDLLSVRHRLSLGGIFGTDHAALFSPEADAIYRLYHHFAKYPEGWFTAPDQRVGDLLGYKHWQDAEHFIETLCDAREHPLIASELSRMMDAESVLKDAPHDWDVLATAAKRVIAAECCGFLKKLPQKSERKVPYERALRQLTGSDTIISFNYDRVVESHSHIEPCRYQLGAADLERRRCVTRNTPLLLKLHGSVDWKIENDAICSAGAEHAMSVDSDGSGLVIPGTDKRDADSGPLAPLWGLARESLKAADGVVFIGFRFPETDAKARQLVVDSLGDRGGPDRRTIHVVLGPRSPDSERVVNILQLACRNGGRVVNDERESRHAIVWDSKLYAEDYLSVASRVLLRA